MGKFVVRFAACAVLILGVATVTAQTHGGKNNPG